MKIVSEAERPTTRLGRGPSCLLLVPGPHSRLPRGLCERGPEPVLTSEAGPLSAPGQEKVTNSWHRLCTTKQQTAGEETGEGTGEEKRWLQPDVTTSRGAFSPAPWAYAEVQLLGTPTSHLKLTRGQQTRHTRRSTPLRSPKRTDVGTERCSSDRAAWEVAGSRAGSCHIGSTCHPTQRCPRGGHVPTQRPGKALHTPSPGRWTSWGACTCGEAAVLGTASPERRGSPRIPTKDTDSFLAVPTLSDSFVAHT